jgi:hypothetical protein
MRYKASFNWPATFWAIIYTLKEWKTTIQAPICDSYSRHPGFSIDSDPNFNRTATFWAKICMFREPVTTMQAPICDSCLHLLFLFYRPGLYPFSKQHSIKHNPIYIRSISEQLHISLTNLPLNIPKTSQKMHTLCFGLQQATMQSLVHSTDSYPSRE